MGWWGIIWGGRVTGDRLPTSNLLLQCLDLCLKFFSFYIEKKVS